MSTPPRNRQRPLETILEQIVKATRETQLVLMSHAKAYAIEHRIDDAAKAIDAANTAGGVVLLLGEEDDFDDDEG